MNINSPIKATWIDVCDHEGNIKLGLEYASKPYMAYYLEDGRVVLIPCQKEITGPYKPVENPLDWSDGDFY